MKNPRSGILYDLSSLRGTYNGAGEMEIQELVKGLVEREVLQ